MAYLHVATVYYYEATCIINNNSDLFFSGAWSSTLDDTVWCDAWRDDKLLSSGIYCKKHSTSASSGQSDEESQTKVKKIKTWADAKEMLDWWEVDQAQNLREYSTSHYALYTWIV